MTPKHFTHNNKYDNSEQGELFVFFVFFKISFRGRRNAANALVTQGLNGIWMHVSAP